MAKKINLRDDQSEFDSVMRATGKRKPKAGSMLDTGDNARKGLRVPPSQPTDMSLATRTATDQSYLEKGNPGTDLTGDQAARDRHDMRRGWFLTEAHRQASNRRSSTPSPQATVNPSALSITIPAISPSVS